MELVSFFNPEEQALPGESGRFPLVIVHLHQMVEGKQDDQ